MNPTINAIVIGVQDLDRAKKFYGEGLGCEVAQDNPAFVSFKMRDGSSGLALYLWDALAKDAGVESEGSGFRGVTFNFFTATTDEVDATLAQAERAGARIVRPAEKAKWGGYFGYFSDPDGYLWKVVAQGAS